MSNLIKRTWVVEEAAFLTHKHYTAYEVRKLFGRKLSKELLYENGTIVSQAHGGEGMFSRCAFLCPTSAMEAINLRKQALGIVREKPIKKTLWEVE